jgi:hypothetical protein
MNANELADKLENAPNISEIAKLVKEKVVPMLRYQQASIDRLIGSEPIHYGMLTFCKNCGQQNPYEPKEITDEEINTEMLAYLNSKTMGLEDFAKAILKRKNRNEKL